MSLAVAIQCLETAFGVTVEDSDLALPQTLPEIFEAAAGKVSFGAAPINAQNSENSMGSQWLQSTFLLGEGSGAAALRALGLSSSPSELRGS